MRVLFALNEPYLPDVIGGGVLDMHFLSKAIVADGHGSEVLCARVRGSSPPEADGYPCLRVADVPGALRARLRVGGADIVVVQGLGHLRLAHLASKSGTPVIIRQVTAECVAALHHAVIDGWGRELLDNPRIRIVANSEFIASRNRELVGVTPPVVYPPVPVDSFRYPGERDQAGHVLFVNPNHVKGVDLALQIAGLLPHRRFLFVESWPLSRRGYTKLRLRILRHNLRNVSVIRRRPDLRSIYSNASLLLMPSQWEEAFGRVAVEASAAGLPVVASRIGGLPEALGDAGVLLPADATAVVWAERIEHVLSSAGEYRRLANGASRNPRLHDADAAFASRAFIALAADLASGA